jgi:hypothetical protein
VLGGLAEPPSVPFVLDCLLNEWTLEKTYIRNAFTQALKRATEVREPIRAETWQVRNDKYNRWKEWIERHGEAVGIKKGGVEAGNSRSESQV